MATPHSRLHQLVDREFRQLAGAPAAPLGPCRFKPMKLNIARFDGAWDRKRGSAVRLAGLVLTQDEAALAQRVCENDQTARTYESGVPLLRREAAHLRKMARLLEPAPAVR